MKYEIRKKDKVIGVTKLENGDPPMGFVFGAVEPTEFYSPSIEQADFSLYISETNTEISIESILIEDHSGELGEQSIEVTVLVESAEEYAKFFRHHL
ncbi:hypothetical protein KUV22_12725 [Microbulbifer agarilyticus]|uniref:hypothetical protein n=1 Tax=Microbulbifer agarilyticus TaxID=260552 RepID=UPI001C94B738|nr:hypothetical protein [Microbulbifer agarilyticus]MBY6191291.1 hypothetical protein [Microbulbifer agarilyticus]